MSSAAPTLPAIIAGAIRLMTGDMRTALPARVEAYDAATQKASLQPLVMDGFLDGDRVRQVERLPVIRGVPVLFPGSGDWRLTWPVSRGDTVLAVFCSSAIDAWLARGGEVDPKTDRRHDLADAIAIPGLFDFGHVPTSAPTNAMVAHASSLLLGGPTATAAALKGTPYRAAEDTFNTALNIWLTANGVFITALGALPGMAGPAATMQAANATLISALSTYQSAIAGALSLSTVVKVS